MPLKACCCTACVAAFVRRSSGTRPFGLQVLSVNSWSPVFAASHASAAKKACCSTASSSAVHDGGFGSFAAGACGQVASRVSCLFKVYGFAFLRRRVGCCTCLLGHLAGLRLRDVTGHCFQALHAGIVRPVMRGGSAQSLAALESLVPRLVDFDDSGLGGLGFLAQGASHGCTLAGRTWGSDGRQKS